MLAVVQIMALLALSQKTGVLLLRGVTVAMLVIILLTCYECEKRRVLSNMSQSETES